MTVAETVSVLVGTVAETVSALVGTVATGLRATGHSAMGIGATATLRRATDFAVGTAAPAVLTAAAGMPVRVMGTGVTGLRVMALRVMGIGAIGLRVMALRVMGIGVTVLLVMAARVMAIVVIVLRVMVRRVTGTAVSAHPVTANVPEVTAATVVPGLPALVVLATVTVVIVLRVMVRRATVTVVIVLRVMVLRVTGTAVIVLRVMVLRAMATGARARGTGSAVARRRVVVGAHPVAMTGTVADAAPDVTDAMDVTEDAMGAAATSCGPGTGVRRAATATPGTTSASSPKKSAWRESCGRFVHGTTTRRSPRACRRATSTRGLVSS
ncbi:hypothetical protein ASE16_00005 [Leifsonia sp. Root227]|nr:hypothetical protein ASE16_00005 [Leifsonia sp. Root227]